MTGDEKRLLDLFRSLDSRGKHHVLVIAEAESRYAPESAYTPHSGLLDASAHNLPMEHENDQIEGRDDNIEG